MAAQDDCPAGLALNLSPADWGVIFEAVSDAILIHDGATGEILDVNRGMCEMFGYTPEEARELKVEALGAGGAEWTPESVRHPAAKSAGGSPPTFTFQARDRAGRFFWVEAHLTPVRIDGRDLILTVLRDIDQRRQAEAALQETQELLKAVLDHAHCAVYATDTDGRYRLVNPTWERITRKRKEEVIGRRIEEVFSGKNASRFKQRNAQVIAGDRTLVYKETAIIAGQRRYFHTVQFPLRDISGKIAMVGGISLDITERKQIEKALRQSESSYRVVTESSLAGVYLIQDNLFRYVNPILAQAFGYRVDELIDRLGPLDLVHPDDRARITETMRARLAGEKIGSLNTLKGLRQDGSIIHGEVLTRQVEYRGRPAIMGTFIDVTERRRAEEALKASEEKYRTIFGAVNDAIVVVDPATGEFLEVNRKFLELRGCDPGEAWQFSLADVCSAHPPYTLQDAKQFNRKAVEEGPQLFEWLAELPNGGRQWIEISLALTPLEGRNLLLVVGRDISERKQLEGVRRQAYEELERLVAERTAGLEAANAQLQREIEERRCTEAIIRRQRDLALSLSAKIGLHETLALCLKTGISISGLDSGGVYLVDPTSGALDLVYHQGLSPAFVQQAVHYEADDLNTYLVMAGEPMYARLAELPGLMDADGLQEGLRSAAIIPVIYQDRVIASLNFASHHYEEVPATARAALETLAGQVGSAIARVQAEEALLRAKEELEIRVADRTALLRQANKRLEEELRVRATMEQYLRRSEAQYRTLVEQIPAVTYATSLTEGGDFFYVSPQIETLLGFSPEEWRAEKMETWKRQIHPDDRERVLAEINRTVATGEPFAAEYRILAKSGRVAWFQDEARVIHDQEGKFYFLQGLALDITKRKEAEDALRETTQTLQALIQASPLAIIVLDRDLKIRLWNPGAERTFGWSASEVLGRHLPYIPGDQQAEAVARIQRSLAGEMLSALELTRQKKDGAPIAVQLWTALLIDARGEEVGIMGIFADITERKRAEEAVKKSERELRLLTARLLSIQEEERRRVARELHDELGQALTVLKINLVAIEGKLSARQKHLKADCEQMLSYIDTVIENVRRLSWDLSPSSLEDLGLSSALGYLVDETCRKHQMQSAVAMDEVDPLFPPATQINIYRIFQESLTNVVKHAGASLVSVKVKRENGNVSFMVGDNGRGFDLKRAMARKGARKSLGLTAMNQRALMANGTLQISSRKGRGTIIRFTIPIGKPGK